MDDVRKPFFKVDVDITDNQKVARVGTLGLGYYIALLAYASRNRTDGFVPYNVAYRLFEPNILPVSDPKLYDVALASGMQGFSGAQTTQVLVETFVDVGLLDVVDGGFVLHDYRKHNSTKAEIEAARMQKVEAGRRGGQRSAEARAQAPAPAHAQANGQASAQAESNIENRKQNIDTKAKTRRTLHAAALPLAEKLRDLLVANSVRVPPKLDSWADYADKLFRIDGIDPEQAFKVLEWSEHDPFWRKQIHGMENFRKHYDRLRMGWEESVQPVTTKDRRHDLGLLPQGDDE